MQMDVFERTCHRRGYKQVAGVDEAGRGALAGPVVAAAVILPTECTIKGLRDSKQLSAPQRARLFDEIRNVAVAVSIGTSDHQVIDRLNILQATLAAMQEAVQKLTPTPDYLLVDGLNVPEIGIAGEAIPKGDSRSCSIAAASVVAKITRDQLMVDLDRIYPNYGLSRHKGYPTASHRRAIAELGASDIHRRTFKLLPDA